MVDLPAVRCMCSMPARHSELHVEVLVHLLLSLAGAVERSGQQAGALQRLSLLAIWIY